MSLAARHVPGKKKPRRSATAWAENLVITTPQERDPESAVRVSKVSVATCVSPKQ
jgi:hypothetical protein